MQAAYFGCLAVLLAPFLVLANAWSGQEPSRAGDCGQWGVTASDDLSREGSGMSSLVSNEGKRNPAGSQFHSRLGFNSAALYTFVQHCVVSTQSAGLLCCCLCR